MATTTPPVRAKRPAGTKPRPDAASTATAKPTTATKPAVKPAGAKPTAKPTATKPAAKPELQTDEAKALAEKLQKKEERKAAAFAKLKAASDAKKAQRAVDRQNEMQALQGDLEVGDKRFLIRASYYGCEVEVLGFDEVRGRNLVEVKVLTTKKGRELDEDKTYTRKVSPKFLVEERPTEAYVKRRGSSEDVEEEAELEEEEATEDLEDQASDEVDAETDDETDDEVEEEAESEEDEEDEDADSEDEEDESWGE
jgi:hypothetical protein